MEFLEALEKLRNPVFDVIMQGITYLGEELLFIVIGLLFLWCVDKTEGYYILTIGFTGTIINQFLKLLFRIPRPWVKNPELTIVESARAEATGYSFPSGHVQSAIGSYGGIARSTHTGWIKLIMVIICMLVPLSRMYLGVHTPEDVMVSALIAIILIFILKPLFDLINRKPFVMHILFGIMTLLGMSYLLFLYFYNFPPDTDAANYLSGLKAGWTLLGAETAIWIFYTLDSKFIHYKVETASIWGQVIKLVLGCAVVLLVKEASKFIMVSIVGEAEFNTVSYQYLHGIRYFLTAATAGAWTLTFPLFAGIGKRKSCR